jgi:hypothetical protein
VLVNGQQLKLDVTPAFISGRLLVPLRAIFAALGANIDWNDATQTVTAIRGSITIRLTIGQKIAYKNGAPVTLDVPGRIINGRTLVPLRFVGEALGCQVGWDDATQTASVTMAASTGVAGVWSTVANAPFPFDLETGEAIGDPTAGTWLVFTTDGEFLRVTILFSSDLSGVLTTTGKYTTTATAIRLTGQDQSWEPASGFEAVLPAYDEPVEDSAVSYELGSGVLSLIAEGGPLKFYRIEDPNIPTEPPVEPPPQPPASSDSNIAGLWSSDGPYGMMVDSNTGAPLGDIYNGHWYLLRADGTYREIWIAAGQFISGTYKAEGRYSAKNGVLRLTNRRETFWPAPSSAAQHPAYTNRSGADEVYYYMFSPEGNLRLSDDGDWTGWYDTFYRAPNN